MIGPKHYITLLNGQSVRVVFNIDVYQEIIAALGQNRFNEIAAGKVDIAAYKILYLALIKAGEALDGRVTALNTADLGRLIGVPQMQELRKVIIEAPADQFMKAVKNHMSN